MNIEKIGSDIRNSNIFSQIFVSAIFYSCCSSSDEHPVNKAASMLRSILEC